MVGVDTVPEDENCAGALDLRSIGVRTRIPDSLVGESEGLEFFVSDPFPGLFGPIFPGSSVA